jgi:hypothetical protein
MRKIILILTACMLFCVALHAQDKKYVYTDSSLIKSEDGTDEYVDSVQVSTPVDESYQQTKKEEAVEIDTALYYTSLSVPKDSVEAWKNLKEFAYVKYLDSLLKAKQDETQKKVKAQASNNQPPPDLSWLSRVLSSRGLEVFLWSLAGLFILFILYKLFLTEGVFQRGIKKSKVIAPEVEEEIIDKESDFDGLIRNALLTGNYRLAVRYHYLQVLHLLANKNQIQLAQDKTNADYVREIVNKNNQIDFAGLTLNYEYVWYGEFEIDEVLYSKLKVSFVSFINKI